MPFTFKGICGKISQIVSYNRFVALQRKACVPLAVFVKMMSAGKCTGISFFDKKPSINTINDIVEKDKLAVA